MQQDAGGSAASTEKLIYLILNEANEATYTTFTTLSVYVMLKFDMKDRCCNLLTEFQTTMQASDHWAWVSVIRSLPMLDDTTLWSPLDSRQAFAQNPAARQLLLPLLSSSLRHTDWDLTSSEERAQMLDHHAQLDHASCDALCETPCL